MCSQAKGDFARDPPLRQRMLEDLQIRQYSPTTIRLYLSSVAEFAKHFHKSPDQFGPEHIRQYQLFLIKEKQAGKSTCVQLVCALRFFLHSYTPTQNRDRAHPVPATPADASAHSQPRGSHPNFAIALHGRSYMAADSVSRR